MRKNHERAFVWLAAIGLAASIIGLSTACGDPEEEIASQRTSETEPGGEAEVPELLGLSYDSAREELLEEGWVANERPLTHGDTEDVQGGNGPLFWARGYRELVSCSGTGYAYCRFEFFDPGKRLLVVITSGEEGEDEGVHATVDRVYFENE